MIAAHEQHLHLVRGTDHEALHGARERQAEQRRDVLARRLAGRRHLVHRLRRRGARRRGRERFGELDVRRVVGRGAVRDRVLARVGEHLELVRREAADVAGVGLRRRET